MFIKFLLSLFILLFSLQGESFECPSETNKVEFTSPVSGEQKKWCQLNVDGKLIKHGPLAIYKDGKLLKKEFYQKGKLQKVGLYTAVEGEAFFHFDAFLVCVLESNHRKVKCHQSVPLQQPHHVFHRHGEEYNFEFPFKVKSLHNDFLSLCGYSQEDAGLVCYDPSFHQIKERLKTEKIYIDQGHYQFKETWSDGKEYNRKMAVEYVDKVIVDTTNPNYFHKKLKAAKRILVHQFYSCVLNESQELDCFSKPSYGNQGSTFYNEKPFPESSFVGGSFSHFCVQKRRYVWCYYFKPQEGFEQKAYVVEKLHFVGPLDPFTLKQLYRNTLFWVDENQKISYKQLRGASEFISPDLVKLLQEISTYENVKRFSVQDGQVCYLNNEGKLFCRLRQVVKATRVQKGKVIYDKLKPLFPKKQFQEIFRPDIPEMNTQFCLKYQGEEKYFCFQNSKDGPIGKDYKF